MAATRGATHPIEPVWTLQPNGWPKPGANQLGVGPGTRNGSNANRSNTRAQSFRMSIGHAVHDSAQSVPSDSSEAQPWDTDTSVSATLSDASTLSDGDHSSDSDYEPEAEAEKQQERAAINQLGVHNQQPRRASEDTSNRKYPIAHLQPGNWGWGDTPLPGLPRAQGAQKLDISEEQRSSNSTLRSPERHQTPGYPVRAEELHEDAKRKAAHDNTPPMRRRRRWSNSPPSPLL